MNDSAQGSDQLPPWFERPRPETICQATLFPDPLPEVLAALRVSSDELMRWHERGWVSFGPVRSSRLEPWDVNEIRFVGDVVRSGLSDVQIANLFADLPRPMTFDPAAVAYSFSLGWVMARRTPEPDPLEVVDEHVDEWLAALAEEEDQGRLTELRDRIDTLIASIEPAGDGDSK